MYSPIWGRGTPFVLSFNPSFLISSSFPLYYGPKQITTLGSNDFFQFFTQQHIKRTQLYYCVRRRCDLTKKIHFSPFSYCYYTPFSVPPFSHSFFPGIPPPPFPFFSKTAPTPPPHFLFLILFSLLSWYAQSGCLNFRLFKTYCLITFCHTVMFLLPLFLESGRF